MIYAIPKTGDPLLFVFVQLDEGAAALFFLQKRLAQIAPAFFLSNGQGEGERHAVKSVNEKRRFIRRE
jgi:hypothetical protein